MIAYLLEMSHLCSQHCVTDCALFCPVAHWAKAKIQRMFKNFFKGTTIQVFPVELVLDSY